MSGNQTIGVVQAVNSKEGQYGTMWSVKVNGEWYGAGKFAPKCKEGDSVEFDFTFKGNYKNMEPRTLRVVGSGGPPASAVPARTGQSVGSSSAPSGGGSWDARQETISRQASLNSAIAWMQLLHAEGAIPLPATVKGGKRESAMRELLNQYTMEFFEQATDKKLAIKAPKVGAETGSEPEEDEGSGPADASGW